jgi:hypothetical protein
MIGALASPCHAVAELWSCEGELRSREGRACLRSECLNAPDDV